MSFVAEPEPESEANQDIVTEKQAEMIMQMSFLIEFITQVRSVYYPRKEIPGNMQKPDEQYPHLSELRDIWFCMN